MTALIEPETGASFVSVGVAAKSNRTTAECTEQVLQDLLGIVQAEIESQGPDGG